MNDTSTLNTIAQGGVTVTAIAFFHDAMIHMVPYFIIAIPLIVLDILWGVRAAKHRKEPIRFSKGFRKTMGKIADYICWIVIAATMSLAFDAKWLEWAILGAVIFNEIMSIIGNYFETKDIEFSMVNLYRWVLKKGAEKAGTTMDDAEAEGIITDKEKKDETASDNA